MSRGGSGQEMGLEDFLTHSTRGGGANFLVNWKKKRNPPKIRVVLHTKASIMAVWSYPWLRVVNREYQGKESNQVWSDRFNSHESVEVLTRQYHRDDDGQRKVPPTICPMALMLEDVYQKWLRGEVAWDQPIFRFEGDDASKAQVFHAAGMIGKIDDIWEKLSEKERKEALARGVPGPRDAWKQSMGAKCEYLFSVVDYDEIGAGIQVARETTLVGDKMKKVIKDRIRSEGPDKGHPYKHPIVFEWSYDANAKNFGDKYDVVAIAGALAIGPEIRDLIFDKDPPDISNLINPGNAENLRASMEDHYIGPKDLLDFDAYFKAIEEKLGTQPAAPDERSAEQIASDISGEPLDDEPEAAKEEPKQAAKEEPKQEAKEEAKQEAQPTTRKRRAAAPAEDPTYVVASTKKIDGQDVTFNAAGDELLPCEKCETIMLITESKCRKCGAEYVVEDAPPATPASTKPSAKPSEPGTAETKAKEAGKDRLKF